MASCQLSIRILCTKVTHGSTGSVTVPVLIFEWFLGIFNAHLHLELSHHILIGEVSVPRCQFNTITDLSYSSLSLPPLA